MDIRQKIINLVLGYSPKVLGAIIALLIGFSLVKGLMKMLDKVLKKSHIDSSLHSFIQSISEFALKVGVVITATSMLGADMTTFIAVLSAAGLAVALSIKDSFANFAGGILILTFRPFNVGEFIETQGYMGTVKEIKLLYTYLNTTDNRRIIIPNGELSNGKIINYSTEDKRRIDLIFGVSYSDDIDKVKSVLNKILLQNESILKDPEPLVAVTELADSSVNFVIKAWCKSEDYWDNYYNLHEKVKKAFDREGITIPFPQNDVHIYREQKDIV